MNTVINTIISCVTYPPTHCFLFSQDGLNPAGGKPQTGPPQVIHNL